MKVKLINAQTMPLGEFADKHNLVLVIEESSRCDVSRYAAYFEKAHIYYGGETAVWVGTGNTPHEAAMNYANLISGRTLSVSFAKPNRENDINTLNFITISVPRLTVTPDSIITD